MRPLAATALLALVLTATACASPRADAPDGSGPSEGGGAGPRAPFEANDPVDLVELWRVSDAEGESDETWLRLEAGEFQLWRDCGMILGSWRAGATTLAASAYGASGGCASGGMPSVPWLESVVAYAPDGEGWVLLDADGEVAATLRIDGAPEPIPSAAESYTQSPRVDDAVRERLALPEPLPAGLAAVRSDDLVARWTPDPAVAGDPFVEFADDGTWTGSDGCNGGSGRWIVGVDGEILATSGPSTLMACDGAAVPAWVATATRAGLDGDRLVLVDASGDELGRLVRS